MWGIRKIYGYICVYELKATCALGLAMLRYSYMWNGTLGQGSVYIWSFLEFDITDLKVEQIQL